MKHNQTEDRNELIAFLYEQHQKIMENKIRIINNAYTAYINIALYNMKLKEINEKIATLEEQKELSESAIVEYQEELQRLDAEYEALEENEDRYYKQLIN